MLYYGFIYWVWGGIGGSVPDLTIVTCNLIQHLLPGERLYTDKGYHGSDAFLTPIQGRWEVLNPGERAWNKLHSCVHFQHIEQLLKDMELSHNPLAPPSRKTSCGVLCYCKCN